MQKFILNDIAGNNKINYQITDLNKTIYKNNLNSISSVINQITTLGMVI